MIKRVPFHSILFAVFPVIALLGNNIAEVSVEVILRPLLVALLGTLVVFLIVRLVTRETLLAGLFTTTFLILFFTYGHVYHLIKESPFIAELGLARHRYLLIVYTVLFVIGSIGLLKNKTDHPNYTLVLNWTGIFLLVFPLYQVVKFSFFNPSVHMPASALTRQIAADSMRQETRPDVYYIILDGYSRSDVIESVLGYDNSPFLEKLEQLGFVIGDCSRSNYYYTRESLLSSLNMDHLPVIYSWAGSQEIDDKSTADFIIHSLVRRQFESMGYKIVAFDTGYEWTRWKDADLYLSFQSTPYGVQWVTPFEELLMDTTLASVYVDHQIQAYQGQFSGLNHPKNYFINQEKFKLSELPKISRIEAPTFTFAHILIPHTPFVFSPDGILTDPGYFDGYIEAPRNEAYFNDGYINEIRFINQQIIPILTDILDHSEVPPIIILQGDHGFGEDRYPILNAYFLPGENSQDIYPAISPVNTFRLIFDAYFGGSYGLLPDESFAEVFDRSIPEKSPICIEDNH